MVTKLINEGVTVGRGKRIFANSRTTRATQRNPVSKTEGREESLVTLFQLQ